MSEKLNRRSFEEVVELAKAKERYYIELKSSALLNINHPNHNGQATENGIRDNLKKCLAKEAGAFANSGGGEIFFGFDDKTAELQDIELPLKIGRQDITDWVGSILRTSLQPEIQELDCYLLPADGRPSVLVLKVPESNLAPHQSVIDKVYYIRIGTAACPGEHWLLEAIRNKIKGPLIKIEHLPGKISFSSISKDRVAGINLSFMASNVGKFMAKDWGMQIISPIQLSASINNSGVTNFIQIPVARSENESISMYKADFPIFPQHQIEFFVRVTAAVQWEIIQGESELRKLIIGGTERPALKFLAFADHATPVEFEAIIDSNLLLEKAYKSLADCGHIRTMKSLVGI
jgi:hypothetical protein